MGKPGMKPLYSHTLCYVFLSIGLQGFGGLQVVKHTVSC